MPAIQTRQMRRLIRAVVVSASVSVVAWSLFYVWSVVSTLYVFNRIIACRDELSLNPASEPARTRLQGYLRSSRSYDRAQAAGAVRQLGDAAGWAMPDLINLVREDDSGVSREAALAIGMMPRTGPQATEALLDVVRTTPFRDATIFAVESLGSVGDLEDARVEEALRTAASSDDLELKTAGQSALEKYHKRLDGSR